MIRNFGNKLGLAWWAKIETDDPCCTYWFGPFITKRSLKENISSFINDLSEDNINASLLISDYLPDSKFRQGKYGYVSIWSEYGGFFVFTTLSKHESITLEHTF